MQPICTCMHFYALSLQSYVSQAGVAALSFFGYINAFLLMLVVIIWARVLHSRLHHALICTPHTRLEPRTTSSHLYATQGF